MDRFYDFTHNHENNPNLINILNLEFYSDNIHVIIVSLCFRIIYFYHYLILPVKMQQCSHAAKVPLPQMAWNPHVP